MSTTTTPTPTAIAGRHQVDKEDDTKTYKNPATTVDALVIRKNVPSDTYELLVIQRGRNPYKGYWALPGGFVDYGEDPLDAVRRELLEETRIVAVKGDSNVRLVAVRGKGDRDPRQHVITIAYVVKVEEGSLGACVGSDDAKDARWVPLETIGSEEMPLAFDHGSIVDDLRAWFKKEGEALGFYVVDHDPKQPGTG
ncbi:hypothetical protein HDV05_000607 [Chytridiales sp. JEL 0842]|nr:hypothetical protein HDV05_000607 [Chytridiales sp. JEL 0842]